MSYEAPYSRSRARIAGPRIRVCAGLEQHARGLDSAIRDREMEGIHPALSGWFTSAPRSISSFTTSRRFCYTAADRGLLPGPKTLCWLRALISAPASSSNAAISGMEAK